MLPERKLKTRETLQRAVFCPDWKANEESPVIGQDEFFRSAAPTPAAGCHRRTNAFQPVQYNYAPEASE
jgi:hypothetical protein